MLKSNYNIHEIEMRYLIDIRDEGIIGFKKWLLKKIKVNE